MKELKVIIVCLLFLCCCFSCASFSGSSSDNHKVIEIQVEQVERNNIYDYIEAEIENAKAAYKRIQDPKTVDDVLSKSKQDWWLNHIDKDLGHYKKIERILLKIGRNYADFTDVYNECIRNIETAVKNYENDNQIKIDTQAAKYIRQAHDDYCTFRNNYDFVHHQKTKYILRNYALIVSNPKLKVKEKFLRAHPFDTNNFVYSDTDISLQRKNDPYNLYHGLLVEYIFDNDLTISNTNSNGPILYNGLILDNGRILDNNRSTIISNANIDDFLFLNFYNHLQSAFADFPNALKSLLLVRDDFFVRSKPYNMIGTGISMQALCDYAEFDNAVNTGKSNNSQLCFKIAMSYLEASNGLERSYKQYYKWLEMAYNLGCYDAIYPYASIFVFDDTTNRETRKVNKIQKEINKFWNIVLKCNTNIEFFLKLLKAKEYKEISNLSSHHIKPAVEKYDDEPTTENLMKVIDAYTWYISPYNEYKDEVEKFIGHNKLIALNYIQLSKYIHILENSADSANVSLRTRYFQPLTELDYYRLAIFLSGLSPGYVVDDDARKQINDLDLKDLGVQRQCYYCQQDKKCLTYRFVWFDIDSWQDAISSPIFICYDCATKVHHLKYRLGEFYVDNNGIIQIPNKFGGKVNQKYYKYNVGE